MRLKMNTLDPNSETPDGHVALGVIVDPGWLPAASPDIQAVYDGWISVSPLHIDLTHEGALKTLGAALSGSS